MQPEQLGQIAPWRVGPPAPRGFTIATRCLQLATCVGMLVWVFGYLGGVRASPKPTDDGEGNDTSQLFNWHPICMTLAFIALMGEALLAYKAPLVDLSMGRRRKKLYHAALQTAALALASGGLAAVFASHNLKRPTPMSNLYSVHSFVGMSVFVAFVAQLLAGLTAYLYPTWHQSHRVALGPVHAFLGAAIFVGGGAAIVTGLQEKATFLQLLAKPASVYGGLLRLPAMLGVLALMTVAAVLYHHAETAQQRVQRSAEEEGAAGVHAVAMDEYE